jgi:transposase
MESQDSSIEKTEPNSEIEPGIELLMATVDSLRPLIEFILKDMYPSARGRPPYPAFCMFKLWILRTFDAPSLRDLHRSMKRSPKLLSMTGLQRVPPHQTMSNFFIRLGPERVQLIMGVVVKELMKRWPDFGQTLSIDGTTQKAWARNNQGLRSTVDPDARWGYKEHKTSGKIEFIFGYRCTIATDANHETPIIPITTAANANESRLYIPLLIRVREMSVNFEVTTADAQYDSRRNNELTITAFKAKPVIQINTRSSKFAKQTGHHKWDYFLPIRRSTKTEPCDEWDHYSNLRNASERVNSSLKLHVGLQTLKTRGLRRVTTFFNLCILTKQLFALTAARFGLDGSDPKRDFSRSVLPWCH